MFLGRRREDAGVAGRRIIRSVLVVEDEPLVAFDNEHVLEQAGYRVTATVEDYDHAVRVIEQDEVDLIIADVALHGKRNGIDVARHAAGRGLPVLFVTGSCPVEGPELAVGCLAKPYVPRDLLAAILAVEAMLTGIAPPRLPPGLSLFERAI